MIDHISTANPGCRAVWGVGLRPLSGWDCGFESHQGHGCLSVVFVVCCEVEVLWRADHSSRGSYRLCVGSLCDLETSRMRRPWPTLGRSATGKETQNVSCSSAYDFLLKLQFPPCLIKHKAKNRYWGMEINSTNFLRHNHMVSFTFRPPYTYERPPVPISQENEWSSELFEYLEDIKALWLCSQFSHVFC
jgi:hypothetical protein